MIENSCYQIIEERGVGWLFERTKPLTGMLLRDNMGIRNEGLQDLHAYAANGTSAIFVPYNNNYAFVDDGSFVFGAFIALPKGTSGSHHTLFYMDLVFSVMELNGEIIFEVSNSDGTYTQITTTGFPDLCDGNMRLYFFTRNAVKGEIRIDIFGQQYFTAETQKDYANATSDFYIGARFTGNGVGFNAAKGTVFSGVIFIRGRLSDEEKYQYWKEGNPTHGCQVFLKLDDAVGQVCADSSVYGNNALILNYTSDCRITDNRVFSWQNTYGYSIGQYIIDNGTTGLKIGEFIYPIDPQQLIPAKLILDKSIDGGFLQYQGRVNINAHLTKLPTLISDGAVYGLALEPQKIQFRPGQDTCAFAFMYSGGTTAGRLFEYGDKVIVDTLLGGLFIYIGGYDTTFAITNAMHSVVLNIGISEADVWVDGIKVDTFTIDNSYNQTEYLKLFNPDEPLVGCTLAFLGIRTYMTDAALESWFTIAEIVAGEWQVAYVAYSRTDMLFDVSGNYGNMQLYDVTDAVWLGRQSIFNYLAKGFSEIKQDANSDELPIMVPYTADGRVIKYIKQDYNYRVEHPNHGGLPIFDGYVNMNPSGKRIGVWATFWDKYNQDVWENLNSTFLTENPFDWNIQELVMSELLRALKPSAYNIVFSGSESDRNDITIELHDVIVLNTGNNNMIIPIQL